MSRPPLSCYFRRAADPSTVRSQNCDMNEEMRTDCVDLVITAIERYANSYEVRPSRPSSRVVSAWGLQARGARLVDACRRSV